MEVVRTHKHYMNAGPLLVHNVHICIIGLLLRCCLNSCVLCMKTVTVHSYTLPNHFALIIKHPLRNIQHAYPLTAATPIRIGAHPPYWMKASVYPVCCSSDLTSTDIVM